MKKRSFLPVLALCVLLTGCVREQDVAVIESCITTEALQTLPPETLPAAPTEAAETPLAVRLEETEARHAALQKRLMEDSTLTQADMNEITGQEYTLWDTLLNELWTELTHTLPQAQMEQLLLEERAWIRWKEHSVALAANYNDGGSLSILSGNSRAAALTRDRAYELAEMLDRKTYPLPQSESCLYTQVFLPLAATQQPDLESLQLLLEFRGLHLTEDEGTVTVRDPSFPEDAVHGLLSNESGTVTLAQVLFQSGSEKSIRVDFSTVPADYYTDAPFWDEGTEVSSLEELTEYLQK